MLWTRLKLFKMQTTIVRMSRVIFLCLTPISCNLFITSSKLIKYFLMSLTISFATWWFLISRINWFIVWFDRFRFIDFMLSLTRSWRFFALIFKIFRFYYALFWWTVNEYCVQILTSRMNSIVKFFKGLYCYRIRFCIILNLW